MNSTAVTTVEVDVRALRHNLEAVVKRAGRPAYCVVKADAYGHGDERVVQALAAEAGCAGFLVSRVEEALALSALGSFAARDRKPLVCLGAFLAARGLDERTALLERLNEGGVAVVVQCLEDVQALAEVDPATTDQLLPVHVAVDTGMHREGLDPEQLAEAVERLQRHDLTVASIFSHFAEAEVESSDYTRVQRERFGEALDSADIRARSVPARPQDGGPTVRQEVEPPALHFANSAAALRRGDALPAGSPDAYVRTGGALYGVVELLDSASCALTPAMSVRSRIVQLKRVSAGEAIGYNRTFVADRPMLVGLVALGYADGLPALPAALGWVPTTAEATSPMLRVPVVGKVSMDLVSVDLSQASQAAELHPKLGDEIVALGRPSGGQTTMRSDVIHAMEHAALNGVSPYTITVAFGRRNPTTVIGQE